MLTIQLNKDGTYTIEMHVESGGQSAKFSGTFQRVESSAEPDPRFFLRAYFIGEEHKRSES